jgi:hypothetical protein
LSGGDPPNTVHGVAPQAIGAVTPPAVVVARRSGEYSGGRRESEPVIALTRAKPSSASNPGDRPGPIPNGNTARAEREQVAKDEPAQTLLALASAHTPDEVVSALVSGLELVAARVVVFSARGESFHARDASAEVPGRDWVRSLQLSVDRPSVLKTAIEAGQYVGPLPSTEIHRELAVLLGDDASDVAVHPVVVSGRPTLVVLMSAFSSAYLATRRADQLAQAASRALERIVRERKH